MSRLSEANYQSRRIKLRHLLAAAVDSHAEVSLRRELDEASETDVAKAKANVIAIEDRLSALDAAWQRASTEYAAEVAAAEVRAARSSHAVIAKHLATRATAARAMEKAADALAAQYVEYQAAGAAIIACSREHPRRFGRDGAVTLRENINGLYNDVRVPIGRVLAGGGLNLSGFAAKSFKSDAPFQKSIVAFVERTNGAVEQGAGVLIDAPSR